VTDRIDQLLETKDAFDRAVLAALDDTDRADAMGRAVDPNDANRLRALGILAASDPSSGGSFAQAVGQVLGAGQVGSFDFAAVIASAVVLGADAVPLIQPAAGSTDPVVAVSAWRALQHIAPGAALSALQQSAPQPGTVVGDQAAFALSVIAYRARVPGLELPVPDDTHIRAIPQNAETVAISTAAPTDDDFNLLTLCSSGELYGIAPAQNATLAIDCGEDHMLACLDPTIQAGLPATLLNAPALVGIVAVLDPLGTGYATRWITLTQPDGAGGVSLGLFQPDGAQIYRGTAAPSDVTNTDATFALMALDAPGVAPVSLNVVASTNAISFSGNQISSATIGVDRLDPDPDE
jgi:hypothetical protein